MDHDTKIILAAALLYLAAFVALVSFDMGQDKAMDAQLARHYGHHDNFREGNL